MADTTLERVDESWQRALCVVAHPDDLEYGTAAAVARWTDQGKTITYCLVTSGEAGIDTMRPEQAKIVREQEERDSAALVGVDTVEFLGFPDGIVEYGVPLRRAIAGAIRRHRPELVITLTFDPEFEGGILNQPDHIAAGRATLDAARDAGNRWVFPKQLEDGLEPWSGVRAVLAAAGANARHGVDVSDTFDRGLASLRAHEQYLAALGGGSDPTPFLTEFARAAGERLGCTYGLLFREYRIG